MLVQQPVFERFLVLSTCSQWMFSLSSCVCSQNNIMVFALACSLVACDCSKTLTTFTGIFNVFLDTTANNKKQEVR